VLQASKLVLDGGASSVEVAEPLGAARDERVAAVGLDPHVLGLTLPGQVEQGGEGFGPFGETSVLDD